MSNSNFNITKVVVDPTSQEITNLEINGKAFESGSEANLEERVYDADNKLNVETLFWDRPISVQIGPSSGYDGLERVTIDPDGITGYPTGPDHLFVKKFIECDSEGDVAAEGVDEYNGSITDTEYSEVEASVIYINDTKISFTSKKIDIIVPGGKDFSYYIYYWPYESKWIKMSD